jgi:undecaprenyl pyrophosphate synthase
VKHLALIPDGNRRWAAARGLGPGEGHRAGIARVPGIAEAAWEEGVEVVSLWWGSPANLQKRAPAEVADIVGTLAEWLHGDAGPWLRRHGAAFEAIGRWRELAPGIAPLPVGGPGPRRFVLLMAYDGREEIIAAAHDLPRALWTAHLPAVDLVIRTGGEPHLSAGFMLWHIAEARLAFVDVPWPDLDPATVRSLVRAAPPRRFGA